MYNQYLSLFTSTLVFTHAKIGVDTAENEPSEVWPTCHSRRRSLRRDAGLPGDAADPVGAWVEKGLRSEVNIELNFPPKLRGARSRLYRRRFLQVNTRWKALAEIYTMHSFAPFSNLNFFVKNRQNFFAIELMNIH